jgi:hypothetical protein
VDGIYLSLSLLVVLFALAAVVVHLIEWHLYTNTRGKLIALRESMAAMTKDRDGWRSVAERALVIAQIGRRVTIRATHAATTKASENEPARPD